MSHNTNIPRPKNYVALPWVHETGGIVNVDKVPLHGESGKTILFDASGKPIVSEKTLAEMITEGGLPADQQAALDNASPALSGDNPVASVDNLNSKANTDASNANRGDWRNRLYATEKIAMTGNLSLSETTARNLLLDPDGSDREVILTDTEGLPVFIRHEGLANQIDVGGVVNLWPGDSCAILYDGTNPVLVGHTVALGVQTIYERGGTPFTVTIVEEKVTLNSNPIELTLPRPGKWRVQGTLVAKGEGLTTTDNELNVYLHGDGNSNVIVRLEDYVTSSQHIAAISLPPVYVDWNPSNNVISLYAVLYSTPDEGDVVITQASLVAERVGP